MAIASGAGANSLRAIGTGVIGGMLASTAIASFFVPLFFVTLEEATGIFSRRKNHTSEQDRGHPKGDGDKQGEGGNHA
jgi:multidrug efflux pump